MQPYPANVRAFWEVLNIFVLITMSDLVKSHKSPIIVALPGLFALILNFIWIKKEKDNWTKGYKIAMGVYIAVLSLFTIAAVRMAM
ncbi:MULTISPECIES: hypothetical protein [Peptoniphilus]|jgi:hypothetical protein|uniref:hypothetical protein n=1 Tax=Peptoniphilus TaxID=162289 RepID=UPI000289CD67|nr:MULTISPECIES: hypothetical protein [Peptoniphilus]MBS6610520.1 hypothetical protein [Peptoniphilus harei]MDU1954906.1 hypothetical protein [Peptoniphilus lacydonensis]MDU2114723.1 hypothetical protein [Peptoniphilus lacydonensis]MDU5274286.1 hypothetical protein [Peptoniphilus lacydonensis]MDU5377485.1 hypothetical protein [Peptoniphilus lacydonensis]